MTDPVLAANSPNGRVYRDNLPPCPLLDELGYEHNPDVTYPSVTAVLSGGIPKTALVPWAAKIVAEYAVELGADKLLALATSDAKLAAAERAHKTGGDVEQPDAADIADRAIRILKKRPDEVRDTAAVRGTKVHSIVEHLAAGDVVPTLGDDLEPWIKSARQFVADFRPKVIWSETTVFNRQFGYAGTLDLVADLPGHGRYVIDYKTSKAVYGDTGVQLAAYRYAEYGIHQDARRRLPDSIEGGLVVHLTADGYKVVPVECGATQLDTFVSAMYVADHCRNARRLLGTPLRPANHDGDDLDVYKAWLIRRIQVLLGSDAAAGEALRIAWPLGVPTMGKTGHTLEQLNQIEAALDHVEAVHDVPFGEAKPAPAGPPATSMSRRPGRGKKQEQAA